jgi:16S rRNA (cytosine1402-N4)-methyltransferase
VSLLHKPVLLKEVIDALLPAGRSHDGAIFVDGTFGAGGYTRALLDAANCTVFAIDRDPDAIKGAAPLIASGSRSMAKTVQLAASSSARV